MGGIAAYLCAPLISWRVIGQMNSAGPPDIMYCLESAAPSSKTGFFSRRRSVRSWEKGGREGRSRNGAARPAP